MWMWLPLHWFLRWRKHIKHIYSVLCNIHRPKNSKAFQSFVPVIVTYNSAVCVYWCLNASKKITIASQLSIYETCRLPLGNIECRLSWLVLTRSVHVMYGTGIFLKWLLISTWLFYWFYSLEIQAHIIYNKKVFIKSFINEQAPNMDQRLVG